MKATLERMDERLREGLMKPAGRVGKGICAALTVLAFILLMMTRTLNLIADAQMSVRIALAVYNSAHRFDEMGMERYVELK